ncbi:hypothetical protein [Microscilla marina]|uniref:Uncharacterized protein n=1 Tax=Microscilla marina ATCC 23134 TaxID=313606 RepID=A1ZDH0_MICM2|nr:hypothetical protein [Microscilla marina]EAY31709.1 hypothetical protein M23134_05215 [Microscilla marina ATCC 23134]
MEQVLYHYDDDSRSVVNEVSLVYIPEEQTGVLRVEKVTPYDVQQATPNQIEEIKAPFTCKNWWNFSTVSSMVSGVQMVVTLYVEVYNAETKIVLTETLKRGWEPPLGWTQDPTENTEALVFEVKDLLQLYQRMQAMDNLQMLDIPIVGNVAKQINEAIRRMKFKNAPGYAIFEKIKKLIVVKEINELPEEEKSSIAEQLGILAHSVCQQFYDTSMALEIVSLGQEVEGVLPTIQVFLSDTKAK